MQTGSKLDYTGKLEQKGSILFLIKPSIKTIVVKDDALKKETDRQTDRQPFLNLGYIKISALHSLADICFLHVSPNEMFHFMLCIPLCK